MMATSPSSFTAREDKTCNACGFTIAKGKPYTWDRSEAGKAYHPDCMATKRATPSPAGPVAVPAPVAPAAGGDVMAGLAGLMAPYLQGALNGKVDAEEVRNIAQSMLDEQFPLVAQALANMLRKELTHTTVLEVKKWDGTSVKLETPHKLTAKVLKLVNTRCFGKRLIPYLFGPAGSGKTTIAFQVAKALDLPCYVITLNRQSTPSLIVGFVDAHGKYQTTEYYDGWKLGGVVLIDELDNGSGNLMTTFNSGLANGRMSFPGVGTVEMSDDTIVIGAGNTALRGGNGKHNERQKMDDATIDRLVYVAVNYDEAQELALALMDSPGGRTAEWVKYVQAVRKRATEAHCDITISPRASYYGAAMMRDGASWEDAIEGALCRGVAPDTWARIR